MLPFYTSDADLASIKLIATDMDLTLLPDDKSMPAGVDERVRALAEAGVYFCAASGRPAPALRECFAASHGEMALIPDNGGTIFVRDELIYRDLLDVQLYRDILTCGAEDGRVVPALCAFETSYVLERDRAYHDELSIYYKDIVYVDSFADLDVEANKVSVLCPDWNSPEVLANLFEPAFSDRIYITCAGNEWIDFMNHGIDKGAGIRRLAAHLGIKLADVAAFGDTYNDIPMLETVGHSFLVANAAEHMEAHARYRCPSNNDGGVLEVIDAILAAKRA